ncbi:MAG TPA: polysaccharide deacetylase family protein [Pirellulales bacterium]|nr:polysaccharide deacetylase family protein [Pirellulales bacterium]
MKERLTELPLLLADVPATLRQALAQEGVPFEEQSSGHAAKFVLFDSRRSRPFLNEGQVAIDVDLLRSGRSRDPFTALADEGAACYEWQIGGLAVRETVARVDRAAVRGRLLNGLRIQIEAAGGVWLRVSPYPRTYRTAFNFRLDHDDYDSHDFDATLKAIAGHEHAISHYVCAATHAWCPEAFARMKGWHVGSHGWWHHTYREPADNLTNVRRGIESLRAMGLDPVGFAAPHGRFNAGLLAALEELGVTHSSEFGLAYDDLPFFPRQSEVLQIPVHPICLGVCLDAARRSVDGAITQEAAAETALEHWRAVIAQKHAAREPIFFYGHPDRRLGRYPRLLREVLDDVSQLPDVWRTTLADFECWWRERAKIKVVARRTEQGLEIKATGLPARHLATLEHVRGKLVAEIELDQRPRSYSDGALNWRPLEALRSFRLVGTTSPAGLRAGLRSYLDWERVTPLDEISVRTWRGWAKRTLRRMRA